MQSSAGIESGILGMIAQSGPVVQSVLFLLVVLSISSWAIAFAKILFFRRALASSSEFRTLFWETRNLHRVEDSTARLSASPLAHVFDSGYRELNKVSAGKQAQQVATLDTVEQALKRAEIDQARKLEKGNTFLASVASSAPFIGLFGTVWGIMNAFHGLGSGEQQSTLQAVAPGISEALVATAVGLAAAIPAAVAYNYFAVAVRQFRETMDRFSSEFIVMAKENARAEGEA